MFIVFNMKYHFVVMLTSMYVTFRCIDQHGTTMNHFLVYWDIKLLIPILNSI